MNEPVYTRAAGDLPTQADRLAEIGLSTAESFLVPGALLAAASGPALAPGATGT